MKLEAAAQYTAGIADGDPAAEPQALDPKHYLTLARRQGDADINGRRLLLVLDAPATEAVTLELWAVDDATIPNSNADSPNVQTYRWYLFASAVVVTGRTVTEVTAKVPPGGLVYGRRTADTIGATLTRTLKATCVA